MTKTDSYTRRFIHISLINQAMLTRFRKCIATVAVKTQSEPKQKIISIKIILKQQTFLEKEQEA